MHIRDLDYLDGDYSFNDSDEGYIDANGPHSYSMIWSHRLLPVKDQGENTGAHESDGSGTARDPVLDISSHDETKDQVESPNPDTKQETTAKHVEDSIATVVSIFLNGNAMQWSDQSAWTQKLARKPDKSVSDDFENPSPNVMEVITAYKLMLLPAAGADWRNFLVPYERADVNRFIRDTPFTPISLTDIQGSPSVINQEVSPASHNLPKDPGKKAHTVRLNPSGVLNMDSSPADHIEFTLRRHLEHILCVCSVPLEKPLLVQDISRQSSPVSDRGIAVALTCGDISGHRICTSASL